MAGFITKRHLIDIAKSYGIQVAIRAMFTKQPTFLGFLVSEGLI